MKHEDEIHQMVQSELDSMFTHKEVTYNSLREKYATLLEDWERIQDEVSDFSIDLDKYWQDVKFKNIESQEEDLKGMDYTAKKCIVLLVQIIAKIEKEVKQ